MFPGEGGGPCSPRMGGTHGARRSASSPVPLPSQRLSLGPGPIAPHSDILMASSGRQHGHSLPVSPHGKNLAARAGHAIPLAPETLLVNSALGT